MNIIVVPNSCNRLVVASDLMVGHYVPKAEEKTVYKVDAISVSGNLSTVFRCDTFEEAQAVIMRVAKGVANGQVVFFL